MTDLILSNARIVLANEVLHGSVRLLDGVSADSSAGSRTGSG